MRVLVIPEDFRYDQYLLKPLFERLFRSIGKPRTRVRVCQNPLLGGVDEALKSERIQEVVDQHDGMTDIFILCVDRDGNRGRRTRLNRIEAEFGNDRTFLAENAWEEIETWALAGLDIPAEGLALDGRSRGGPCQGAVFRRSGGRARRRRRSRRRPQGVGRRSRAQHPCDPPEMPRGFRRTRPASGGRSPEPPERD